MFAIEKKINSWEELENEFFNPDKCLRKKENRFRTKWVFRGHEDYNYILDTPIQRLWKKIDPDKNLNNVEEYMIRNFKKYACNEIDSKSTIWYWLSKMQHHSLPSRLLDWTNSLHVALHFMTCNLDKMNVDGTIWAVNLRETHEFLPKNYLEKIKLAKAFTIDELEILAPDLEKFDEINSKCMIFFEPPSIDDRIANQYALFSVMPGINTSPEEWLKEKSKGNERNLAEKWLIPAELKPLIRDRLDMLNATERVFFPGLDGLCNWLRRYYGPSPKQYYDYLMK